jgi:hypothetical protein
MGDELWFYYGGWVGAHNEPEAHANIGVATLRVDGFCSMHAGQEEGRLVSRREPFVVPKVTINARCDEGGYVLAELLDADGNVIEGFSREECRRFTGDSIAHVLSWQADELPADAREGDKKIRFILRNADLYSYLPDQTPAPRVLRYVPEEAQVLPSSEELPAGERFRASGKESGYSLVEVDGRTVLDLHSVAAEQTTAALARSERLSDETDWRLEQVARVVDDGDQPIYGLSTFFRPDNGRAAALHLSETATGIVTQRGNDYTMVAQHEMDTTDAFHHYALVHEGGADGTVALLVDGEEVLRVPMSDLQANALSGSNVVFGPNAGHREGHLQFAKFGYRIAGTDPVFEGE